MKDSISLSETLRVAPGLPGLASPDDVDRVVALLRRMAARDEAALGEFYELLVPLVFGLVLRITGTRPLAEEVVADSFLQVWQQAHRYDSTRGRPLAWLLTIARSRAIDALRRADPAQPLAGDVAVGTAPATGDADTALDPLAQLAVWQRDRLLHQAMATLSSVQRQVIALAYFRGLSHSEIATHLALPLGTVKSHVRIALQALRRVLVPDSGAPA